MKTYWCGWEVPTDIPGSHMLAKWPSGMRGWVSGYTALDEQVYVGHVDAESIADARAIVGSCYGKSADKIRERWEPKEHDLGWRPPGGRFT
jgi:hypothetical protein